MVTPAPSAKPAEFCLPIRKKQIDRMVTERYGTKAGIWGACRRRILLSRLFCYGVVGIIRWSIHSRRAVGQEELAETLSKFAKRVAHSEKHFGAMTLLPLWPRADFMVTAIRSWRVNGA